MELKQLPFEEARDRAELVAERPERIGFWMSDYNEGEFVHVYTRNSEPMHISHIPRGEAAAKCRALTWFEENYYLVSER